MTTTSQIPTKPAPPVTTPPEGYGEREAFGLEAIRQENRRLVAFGFEVLAAGGWECAIGDILDVTG